jgi:hypothetical protein
MGLTRHFALTGREKTRKTGVLEQAQILSIKPVGSIFCFRVYQILAVFYQKIGPGCSLADFAGCAQISQELLKMQNYRRRQAPADEG